MACSTEQATQGSQTQDPAPSIQAVNYEFTGPMILVIARRIAGWGSSNPMNSNDAKACANQIDTLHESGQMKQDEIPIWKDACREWKQKNGGNPPTPRQVVEMMKFVYQVVPGGVTEDHEKYIAVEGGGIEYVQADPKIILSKEGLAGWLQVNEGLLLRAEAEALDQKQAQGQGQVHAQAQIQKQPQNQAQN